MSKLINAVLLFIVGTTLSFTTNNFIVTTVGCFLAGLVLNRGRKQGSARPVFLKTDSAPPRSAKDYPVRVSTSIRCGSCGATAKKYTKCCTRCGSEMRTPPTPTKETKETVMFCTQCGARVEIDSEFCARCGTKVVA